MIQQLLFTIGDKLYILKKRILQSQNPIIENWKAKLRAEHVFTHEGYYLFADEIPDLDVIEITMDPIEPKEIEIEEPQVEEFADNTFIFTHQQTPTQNGQETQTNQSN